MVAGTTSRLFGVDVARGLAVLGMLWVHFAPDATGSALPDGRSAILFATLAGVSLGLLTGGADRSGRAARWAGWQTVAIRGAVLIVLGRLLVLLGTPIAVILDYYGVLFLLLLPILFAPRLVLVAVAVLALTLGAATIHALGPDPSGAFESRNPVEWPGQWLFTGLYPVALYAAYVAIGLICARSDLAKRRTQLTMVVGGAVVSPAGYLLGGVFGTDAGAHADTTWEAIGSGAIAVAVIGLLQLLSAVRPVRTVLSPIADTGSMPLTVYTGQVVVAAVFLTTQPPDLKYAVQYWWLLIAMIAGSVLFAVVWRRLVGRGPLEQLLAWASGASRTGRSARDGGARDLQTQGALLASQASQRPRPSGRWTASVIAAAVLAVALVAATAPSRSLTPAGSSSTASAIDDAAGAVALRVEAAVLGRSAARLSATGPATAAAATVRLPVSLGSTVSLPTGTAAGVLTTAGAGFSLQGRTGRIEVTDLTFDLDAHIAAGTLSIPGTPPAPALLFELTGTGSPRQTSSGDLRLTGITLSATASTAARITQALGVDTIKAGGQFATISALLHPR